MARDPKFDDGFSEMLPVAASHAGMGHNQGPEWLPIGKELEDRLKKAHKKAIARAQDLIDATPIAAVGNEAQLKKATERVRPIPGQPHRARRAAQSGERALSARRRPGRRVL
jgi:hypothetical protein